MNDFIEERIIAAIKRLLTGQANELLKDAMLQIPLIEFGSYEGKTVVAPEIRLNTCERTEKERIVRHDAYTLTITFTLPESPESEKHCYAYASAVFWALGNDPTLNGTVNRAMVSSKKYKTPKKPNCGETWGVELSLRVTVENDR